MRSSSLGYCRREFQIFDGNGFFAVADLATVHKKIVGAIRGPGVSFIDYNDSKKVSQHQTSEDPSDVLTSDLFVSICPQETEFENTFSI